MHLEPKQPVVNRESPKGRGLKSFSPKQLVFVALLGIVMVALIFYRNCSRSFI